MENISLKNILEGFNAPINEEQTWAVCYQSADFLRTEWDKSHCFTFAKLQCIKLSKDGIVCKIDPSSDSKLARSEYELVRCLGLILFQALDYGLGAEEEHSLSPTLEHLLECMIGDEEGEKNDTDAETDEGIEDSAEDEEGEGHRMSLAHVMKACCDHLQSTVEACTHYKAVCRALVAEAIELITFLERISADKEKLKSKDQEIEEGATLEELQKADWARLWIQVMRELRAGVKLKKKDCVQLNPVEYEMTPYEVLMKDIRAKKHNLKHIAVNGDIPHRTKKDAHDIILEFIRSRPPLHPVKERILPDAPLRPLDVREMLLHEIRQEPRLKPTPGGCRTVETSRTKLNDEDCSPMPAKKVIKPDMNLLNFDDSDSSLSDSEDDLEDRNRVSPSPFSPITPLSPSKADFSDGAAGTGSNWRQIESKHKHGHHHAGRMSRSSSTTTPTSPLSPTERRTSDISTPPCLRKRKSRNSIAVCESPSYPFPSKSLVEENNNNTSLLGKIRASSTSRRESNDSSESGTLPITAVNAGKHVTALLERGESLLKRLPPTLEKKWKSSLNAAAARDKENSANGFSPSATLPSSLECLSLTIEEVMHIRNVLTKSELESLLVDPKLHDLVAKGKVCFTCLKTRFSIFGPWATQCKFCKRNVCSKCVTKMRIPTEHFESIPVYTLSPSPPGQESQTDLAVHERTGSAPNSPELSRRSSNSSVFSPQSHMTSSDVMSAANHTPASTATPDSQLSYTSSQLTDKPSPAKGLAGGRRVGRSATMRHPAGAQNKPPAAAAILQGPMMHLCKDCKAMVVNIIKSSRSTLAQAPNIRKESLLLNNKCGSGLLSRSSSTCSSSNNKCQGNISSPSQGSRMTHQLQPKVKATGLSRSSSLCSSASSAAGGRSPLAESLASSRGPSSPCTSKYNGVKSPLTETQDSNVAVAGSNCSNTSFVKREFHLDLKPVYKAK